MIKATSQSVCSGITGCQVEILGSGAELLRKYRGVTAAMYRSLRGHMPEELEPGCTIRVDGESSKVYVDNVISMDDEVLGSTYFLAPPGETTVQIHCSEFSTPEPTVKAYIREAFI